MAMPKKGLQWGGNKKRINSGLCSIQHWSRAENLPLGPAQLYKQGVMQGGVGSCSARWGVYR